MKIRPILRGLISYIPALKQVIPKKGTGGSSSPLYCYSVWMRHLKFLESCGMKKIPDVVGELGPGDSLGIGLSAILSGVNKYYALDIIKHSEIKKNIPVLNGLIELFQKKIAIPNGEDFNMVKPNIDSTSLPMLLNYTGSEKNLSILRINEIKEILCEIRKPSEIAISYLVPWVDNHVIKYNSIDLLFSQAVMEHVIDIDSAYTKMYAWLKPGGYISHEIDFKAHETHNKWYGHYGYSEILWNIIMHGRKYEINRIPLSTHIQTIKNSGFEVIKIVPDYSERIPDQLLKNKFFDKFSEEDKIISSALIIARKK